MSADFNVNEIKIEGIENESGENANDIQNYLDTFNKEIQSTDGTVTQLTEVERVNPDDDDEGTYFVDQSGQYYYQAKPDSIPVLTSLRASQEDGSGAEEENEQDEETEGQENDDEEDGKKFILQREETEDDEEENATINEGSESNQMIMNSNDAFQTVTIVPSETTPGEVSYVLIVQQPDEEDGKIQSDGDGEHSNMNVYDFDENEEGSAADYDVEDDKSKVMKILSRKSQTVTQAHMCNYCNYTSPKRYLLSRHMKSHSEERPHKCSVCERGFKTLPSLQNHVNTHTGTKPHRCKFCDSAFTTSGELVRHVRYRHTHEKPHKCKECDYASVELSKLKRHIRCHTGERPYQCPHCTYASPDTFKLKRHLRIHTGEKPYECDFCGAKFTQSNSLKAHKLIHNLADRPVFPCELCPTTCGRKTDLRIHVQKLHTSDRPLNCKRCGKSFPDRYSFKLHNKTHEGEKCFKCDLCPYASISARHLDSHMLIHTDQKPYQCDQCGQSFRQKQLLKRHQNLYHNPNYIPPPPREKTHQCPECGRSFRHKGNLIRHMAVHDPDSSLQEKQLALKLGRMKKVQIIDGQQVEVMPGIDSEMEDEDDDVVMSAVEGSDGQQYVVLEVIQFAEDGEEDGNASSGTLLEPGNILSGEDINEDVLAALNGRRIEKECPEDKKFETEKDMETCFGFDDEDQDDLDKKDGISMFESDKGEDS